MTGHAVVGLADALGAERIGLDDVSPGPQVAAVDVEYHVRACQAEHVVIAAHLTAKQMEPPPEVLFRQVVRLNHRTHGTVQHHDPLLNYILDSFHLIVLDGAVHFATVFLFLQRLTLVERLLTLTQRNVHLGPAVLVEEHQQGDYRVARLLRGTLQLAYLALRQQQLAVALHLVVIVRTVEIGRHRHAAHPHLAVDNQTIAVHQTGLARTDALNLRARQHNAGRQRLYEEVLKRCLLVLYIDRTLLPDLFFLLIQNS